MSYCTGWVSSDNSEVNDFDVLLAGGLLPVPGLQACLVWHGQLPHLAGHQAHLLPRPLPRPLQQESLVYTGPEQQTWYLVNSHQVTLPLFPLIYPYKALGTWVISNLNLYSKCLNFFIPSLSNLISTTYFSLSKRLSFREKEKKSIGISRF